MRRTGLWDVERRASDYCEFGWQDQWAELRIFRLVRRNKRDYYGSEGWEFEPRRACSMCSGQKRCAATSLTQSALRENIFSFQIYIRYSCEIVTLNEMLYAN
jgi:hypothetical protein